MMGTVEEANKGQLETHNNLYCLYLEYLHNTGSHEAVGYKVSRFTCLLISDVLIKL